MALVCVRVRPSVRVKEGPKRGKRKTDPAVRQLQRWHVVSGIVSSGAQCQTSPASLKDIPPTLRVWKCKGGSFQRVCLSTCSFELHRAQLEEASDSDSRSHRTSITVTGNESVHLRLRSGKLRTSTSRPVFCSFSLSYLSSFLAVACLQREAFRVNFLHSFVLEDEAALVAAQNGFRANGFPPLAPAMFFLSSAKGASLLACVWHHQYKGSTKEDHRPWKPY